MYALTKTKKAIFLGTFFFSLCLALAGCSESLSARTLRAGARYAVDPAYLEGTGIAFGAGFYYVMGTISSPTKVTIQEKFTTERGNEVLLVSPVDGSRGMAVEGPSTYTGFYVLARDVH